MTKARFSLIKHLKESSDCEKANCDVQNEDGIYRYLAKLKPDLSIDIRSLPDAKASIADKDPLTGQNGLSYFLSSPKYYPNTEASIIEHEDKIQWQTDRRRKYITASTRNDLIKSGVINFYASKYNSSRKISTFKAIVDKLTPEDLYFLLLEKDKMGLTALHHVVKNLIHITGDFYYFIWEVLNSLTIQNKEKLLAAKDHQNRTILHGIAEYHSGSGFAYLEKTFGLIALKQVAKTADEDGNTAMHAACKVVSAFKTAIETSEGLIFNLCKSIRQSEIKEAQSTPHSEVKIEAKEQELDEEYFTTLFSQNTQNENPLHLLFNPLTRVQTLPCLLRSLNKIKETLSAKQFQSLVVQKNRNYNTPLHKAVEFKFHGAIGTLLPSNPAEKDQLLSRIVNKKGETVLHLALQSGDLATYSNVLDHISDEALFEIYTLSSESLKVCALKGDVLIDFEQMIKARISAFQLVHYLVERAGKDVDDDFKERLQKYNTLKEYYVTQGKTGKPPIKSEELKIPENAFFKKGRTQHYYNAQKNFLDNTPTKEKMLSAEKYFKDKKDFFGFPNAEKLQKGHARFFQNKRLTDHSDKVAAPKNSVALSTYTVRISTGS